MKSEKFTAFVLGGMLFIAAAVPGKEPGEQPHSHEKQPTFRVLVGSEFVVTPTANRMLLHGNAALLAERNITVRPGA
jgi:hypothetical protein